MDLEERREWLEEQVGRLPDFTWTSLIDSRYAKAGQMEEEEEELLLDRAKFGLQQAQWGVVGAGAHQLSAVLLTKTRTLVGPSSANLSSGATYLPAVSRMRLQSIHKCWPSGKRLWGHRFR
jgi:hypothetical protein